MEMQKIMMYVRGGGGKNGWIIDGLVEQILSFTMNMMKVGIKIE